MDGSPFFLVPSLPAPGAAVLGGDEGRHAATVRRMRVGEQLVLTDGSAGWATATVTGAGRHELELHVGARHQEPAPAVRVVLVQAVPKGEHGELAVDLATQAGADEIVPWQAARCVASWTGDRADRGRSRWTAAARSAAKQARRATAPAVHPIADTARIVDLIGSSTLGVVLHEAHSRPLADLQLPAAGSLVLIVGPEGGLAPEEMQAFEAAGAIAVRLGPQVLRSSAAAAVALGALGVLTDRWALNMPSQAKDAPSVLQPADGAAP